MSELEYKERIAALESMLRELEWVEGESNDLACPVCSNWKEYGHDPDCRLKALLEGKV